MIPILKKEDVKYIVVHCSDTRPGQPCDAAIINQWHVERGFQMIGYHYVVMPDGSWQNGRPPYVRGSHVGKPKDFNPVSIGVCYVGGRDQNGICADTRTEKQKDTLRLLMKILKKMFPSAKIVGHRDLNHGKACPCFDAKKEYADIV